MSALFSEYSSAEEIVWVQEEPENMGAWDFIRPHLIEVAGNKAVRRVARPRSASPAEGSAVRHAANQQILVDKAFGAAPGTGTQSAEEGEAGRARSLAQRDERESEDGRWKMEKCRLQALCSNSGS